MKQFAYTVWIIFLFLSVPAMSDDSKVKSDVADPRHVRFQGQSNCRDLGGLKTKEGTRVKTGLLFRSGELSRLTNQDLRKLNQLGVKSVINFLTEKEIQAHGKNHLPKNVNEISLPIAGGDPSDGGLAAVILEARQKADFSKIPVELNAKIHRLIIQQSNKQYAALIRHILKTEQLPLVFHCSHGVHRTGTATAVVLSALGVPWKTIREDYLLSNQYRAAAIKKRLKELQTQAAKNQNISADQVDMTNMNAFYILQAEYIDAARDEAVKKYGSMENYIHQGLGITKDELVKLRSILLDD